MNKMQNKNVHIVNEKRTVKPIQELNLTDDFLFDVSTEDLEVCKIMIELSLGVKLKSIRWKEGQKVVHNLPGKRGIRMDFYAEDEDGRIFNVEMQKRNEGNLPKRTRFYQALVDAPLLKRGERGFDDLNPLYIVVICDFDLFKCGKYRYTFSNYCKEVWGLKLGDECEKVFLNTKGSNDTEVEQSLIDFLHYVADSNDHSISDDCDERLKNLHGKVKLIKSSERMEAAYMKMEERDRQIAESGRQEGRMKQLIEIVCRMLGKDKMPEEIIEILGGDPDMIMAICNAAKEFAPKYDLNKIFDMVYEGYSGTYQK